MNTLGVSMSTIYVTQVRLFKILAALVHHTQPDQQHSSQFLPYTNTHTHTGQKGVQGKEVHTSQTAPQDTLKSVNGCILFPLYKRLYGDLGDSGTPDKTIHKLHNYTRSILNTNQCLYTYTHTDFPPSLPSTQVGCMLCFLNPSTGHV